MTSEQKHWQERPYLQNDQTDLLKHYLDGPDDLHNLLDIAYELQFRKCIAGEKKAEVLDKLIDTYEHRIKILDILLQTFLKVESNRHNKPDDDIFDTAIKKSRHASHSLSNLSWRKLGLLKASGYTVGLSSNVPAEMRKQILNHIFLIDDLSDIDDREYAAEWGHPKTGTRLKKLADSIASFAKNSKRKNNPSLNTAIQEWDNDLSHLKRTFYDRWGDFPWPNVKV